MLIREVVEDDVPALFEVRVRTDEYRLTHEELTALGITEESVRNRLKGSLKGWLCEVDGQVVGFAMGSQPS
ncbi:MAG TPA: hypothetical protein GXZ82_05750 [Firmicutes bacterium]|nr:hypothetical protein [Bacillota bacterium]